MRKGMAFITAFLLCLMTVPAFALGVNIKETFKKGGFVLTLYNY